MLRQLAWTLGLGIVAMILFGEQAGAWGGAIGFAIGSLHKSVSKAKTDSSTDTTSSVPYLQTPNLSTESNNRVVANSTSVPPSPRKRALFLLGVAAIFCFVITVTMCGGPDPDPPIAPSEEPVQPVRESLVLDTPVWDTGDCLRQNFGQAIAAGMQIPPEVRVFCGYRWNLESLKALRASLESEGINRETLLSLANPKDRGLITTLSAEMHNMRTPPGLLDIWELTSLPLAREMMRDTEVAQKISDAVGNDLAQSLKNIGQKIDWSAKISESGLRRQVLYFSNQNVSFTSSLAMDLTIEELAQLMVLQSSDPSQLPGFGTPIGEIYNNFIRQGIHPRHAAPIGMLDMYASVLQAISEGIEGVYQWRPVTNQQRSPQRPLEIFWTPSIPASWCPSAGASAHGQYCPSLDRIFVKSNTGAKKEEYLNVLDAEIFHELAHAYLNSSNAFDAPFITEGIATANGERTRRSVVAATSTMQNLPIDFSTSVLNSFSISHQMTVASTDSQSIMQFAREKIEAAPLTSFMQDALCHIKSKPLESNKIQSLLYMSAGNFFTQDKDTLKDAYIDAWAIFHYGVDAAGLGRGLERSQLDASVVQKISQDIIENKKPGAADRINLDKLIAAVNSRAQAELATRSIQCP